MTWMTENPFFARCFEDSLGFIEGKVVEKLPLGVAQPEEGTPLRSMKYLPLGLILIGERGHLCRHRFSL